MSLEYPNIIQAIGTFGQNVDTQKITVSNAAGFDRKNLTYVGTGVYDLGLEAACAEKEAVLTATLYGDISGLGQSMSIGVTATGNPKVKRVTIVDKTGASVDFPFTITVLKLPESAG